MTFSSVYEGALAKLGNVYFPEEEYWLETLYAFGGSRIGLIKAIAGRGGEH